MYVRAYVRACVRVWQVTWDKTLDRMRKEQHAFTAEQAQEKKGQEAQFRIARWKLQNLCKRQAEEVAEKERLLAVQRSAAHTAEHGGGGSGSGGGGSGSGGGRGSSTPIANTASMAALRHSHTSDVTDAATDDAGTGTAGRRRARASAESMASTAADANASIIGESAFGDGSVNSDADGGGGAGGGGEPAAARLWSCGDALTAWLWVNRLGEVLDALLALPNPAVTLRPLHEHVHICGPDEAAWFEWLLKIASVRRIKDEAFKHAAAAELYEVKGVAATCHTRLPCPTPLSTRVCSISSLIVCSLSFHCETVSLPVPQPLSPLTCHHHR